MIEIDGAMGEGGGQVLRNALALSAITGQPFRIRSIRAGRKRPGLQRQHLTGVRAVEEVSHAHVTGDTLGSQDLTFRPRGIWSGDYHFAVGTAGSAGLVLQAVLPALWMADGPSTVVVQGGTHNPGSPPAQFLSEALFPLIGAMGPRVRLDHEAWGFYPAGGGQYKVDVTPGPWVPLALETRGEIEGIELIAALSNLDPKIGRRELTTARTELGLDREHGRILEVESPGPGNAVLAIARAENVTEVFTAFGEKRVRAEQVGQQVGRECRAWLDSGVPVGEHLADQLMLPMMLAGGTFRTTTPTLHTTTAIEVIAAFLGRRPTVEDLGGGVTRITATTPPG